MPACGMVFVAALLLTPAALGAQQAPAHPPAAAQPAPVEPPAAPASQTPAPADSHAPAATPAAPAAGDHAPAASQPAAGDSHAKPAAAGDSHAPAAQGAHGEAAGGHGEAEHHGESPLAFAARIANFFILVGVLGYFLRKPFTEHLLSRGQQVRADLVSARETSATAAAQLAEIDKKLQALPAEIEALKVRGKQEIAAEEARIRQTAESERHRLIEQTRREVDLQVRLAKRALTEHAADLAVSLATQQITKTITPDDQTRLVDRYVTQMRKAHD